MARASLAHLREDGERGVERAPEDDAHRLLKVRDGHRANRPRLDNSGVVNENIDAPEPPHRLLDGVGHVIAVGDIAGDGEDGRALLSQIVRRAVEFAHVAGTDGDHAADAGKFPRQLQTETPRAAGDEGDPALKICGGAAKQSSPRDTEANRGSNGEQRWFSRCVHYFPSPAAATIAMPVMA